MKIFISKSLVVILSFFVVSAVVLAWTEPTVAPPNGNIDAPVNTGNTSQYKSGALGVGGLFRGYGNGIFDGSVGIGTADPKAKLHAAGTYPAVFGSDGMLKIKSVDNGGCCGTEAVTLQTSIDSRTDEYTISSYGGNSRHVLSLQPQGGYVGIGTVNPLALLHVKNGRIRIEDTATPELDFLVGALDYGEVYATTGGLNLSATQPSTGVSLYWRNTTSNQQPGIILNGSGNVGIGTTDPATNLHVAVPSGSNSQYITSGDNSYVSINTGNNYGGSVRWASLGIRQDGSLALGLGSIANPKMVIDTNGNVGIGTTDPAGAKLNVQTGNGSTALQLNNFKFKPLSNTEMGVYDSADNQVLIFDQGN